MLQIRALNEDPENNCSGTENDIKVTTEAEETIVVSEYLRALKLKQSNQLDNALHLFLELLEIEILDKLFVDNQDKLFLVKYNCFRNVGHIYQEQQQNNLALHYFIKAVEMDETDVQTMYCLANLALSIEQIQVAKMYYEKCIERNPNHWPSLDGMLQLFCASGNIIEVLAWAMHCFEKDQSYKRAIRVLAEIGARFMSFPFLEELFAILYNVNKTVDTSATIPVVNCVAYNHMIWQKEPVFDYFKYKIHKLDWLTLGNLILQLNADSEQLNQTFLILFKLHEFLGIQIVTGTSDLSNNDSTKPLHSATDIPYGGIDIVSTSSIEPIIDLEVKGRRRGSELKILEQWGWHKSRRSSRKKSVYDTSESIVSTADGFLKRTLSTYFSVSFEDKVSPFSEKEYDGESDGTKQLNGPVMCSIDKFIDESQKKFEFVIGELQNAEFDLYTSIHRYLHYISFCWDTLIPPELRNLYTRLYKLFVQYECCQSWNQLLDAEITDRFRITLLYLEFQYDSRDCDELHSLESTIEMELYDQLNKLQLYSVYLTEKENFLLHARYLWLNYVVSIKENMFEAALETLLQMELLLSKQSDSLCVYLPNQIKNNVFKRSYIHQLTTSLKRKICLCNVKILYDDSKYYEIVDILKESLMYISETPTDSGSLSISGQIEILLECLWNLEAYTDCVVWAEKALKYATDIFIAFPNDDCLQKSWGKTINCILIYMLALIERETSKILQFDIMARLVQSIHKILTKLLDPQPEKNTFTQYTIDCSKAWAILYYVLEGEDDKAMVFRKNRTNDIELSVNEMDEETLFSSIMMFFVAHELLGRRQWCSKDKSHILFMMLDVIVPKLRSPILEPYRDIINECLEQTTYCLYGYPPKKGRMRHVQDHEASQETLSWEKAVQLFNIYRPDVLPDFNSYKIDSITADMEAMLQHILLVFPGKVDVSNQTGPIVNFINGTDEVVPKAACSDLPILKIKCIFYLLADYYFKSRDFFKAIEYYVMDLTIEPTRFDSWAGIALSKSSKCETMLNSAEILRHLWLKGLKYHHNGDDS
ncbi:calcineurin-binding protein cabin-1-like [Topomyia yanbarensis]|uniref:calcineurin-binding protein cabin-1-like n=1 Tax=Topomyia yanbarensis TaxID=2498891 RepID=UPI00273C4203|nr:calcineurin-binding protein cabin-1-like [Topomyia yanbarensis]